MSLAASLAASLLAALSRPAWWAMALAAFLVRGGFLLLLLPIVRLPTPAGLANEIGPTLVGFVFGGASAGFIVLVATISAVLLLWLVLGGLAGATLDLALAREVAADEELGGVAPPIGGGPWRAVAARLLAHVPTAVVLVLGSVRLVEEGYQELIRPGDPAIPIALRIALRIPDVVGALVVAWLAGETVGGLAVRHLAWGAGVGAAIGRGARSGFRPSGLVTLVVTGVVVAAVLLGSGIATNVAWEQLRTELVDGRTRTEIVIALALFLATWGGGLWLTSLALAWRSAAWTFEVARHLPTRTIDSPPG